MWICIANKSAKFHAKRLTQSENIPNSSGGGLLFWNTLYNTVNNIFCFYFLWHFDVGATFFLHAMQDARAIR